MLEILSPIQKQVFQRDKKGQSVLIVSGRFTDNLKESVNIAVEKVSTKEVVARTTAKNITLSGGADWNATLTLNSGYYDLIASTETDTKTVRFGVGLVFACTGHSFGEGIGSAFVTDERAIIQSNIDGAGVDPLNFSAKPEYKSIQDYSFTDSQSTQGFWGILAEKLVKAFDCPVLLYHAAWGGTSLKHWSIAANGGNAVNYAGYSQSNDGKGYPYAKLKNIVQKLVPKTGIHSVLVIHGNNDVSDTRENIEQYYKNFITATRNDANLSTLPFNLAISTWYPETEKHVTTAQLNVIRDVPNVFLGADINKIGLDGRVLDLHLNSSGNQQAAELWANALKPLCKVSTVEVSPIIVVGATNNVLLPTSVNIKPLKRVDNPIMAGLGIFVLLLVARLLGSRIPFWFMVLMGFIFGSGVYLSEKKTK